MPNQYQSINLMPLLSGLLLTTSLFLTTSCITHQPYPFKPAPTPHKDVSHLPLEDQLAYYMALPSSQEPKVRDYALGIKDKKARLAFLKMIAGDRVCKPEPADIDQQIAKYAAHPENQMAAVQEDVAQFYKGNRAVFANKGELLDYLKIMAGDNKGVIATGPEFLECYSKEEVDFFMQGM
ncbi:MAG: hypothetical protein Q4P13_10045 [Psychrobacter sp.]|nr:hypothetical protein [Psychrobacter sp.]